MSLLIKAKFWNKSNNVIIDYSDKAFTIQKKELFKSGTLYRKGNKLNFKSNGVLNTTNNSNEKTDYMNNYHEIKLISVEKKGDSNYVVDCGEWSKDIIDLIEQNATYFLYKGSTIENFMKDKHRYHILSQGDIIKIGKIYLKVLHIKLNKPESKNVKTSSNKDDSDNNNQSNNNNSNNNENENEEIDKELNENNENNENNKSTIKNDLIIEGEQNQNQSNKKKIIKGNTNFSLRYLTESFSQNNGKLINNKNINRSMVISQKLNLTQRTIDINNINEGGNLSYIKQSKKWKKSRNKNDQKKKAINDKEIDKDKENLINEKSNKKIKSKICRICFNSETNSAKNPLICPCICKGSMKYIHYLCLKNWLNLKVESELGRRVNIEKEKPTITYNKNEIRCELCKSKFPDYVRHNDKLYNVSFYKPKYEQFIVFESVRNDNRRTKFIHIIPLNNYSMHRVGRLNNCDLSLPDNSVSRVHCCLYIENGQLVLENNSKYGTKVLVQNPKLNIVPDYPLCIETQNTYLKIYVKRGFQFFSCCGDSTKSYVRMHPYQNQNQKGFDLFCSMVFKSDDENDSEDEKEENEEGENNINLIDNTNNDKDKDNNENTKKDEENKENKENKKTKKEDKKDNSNKGKKNKDKNVETKSNINDNKDKEQYLETKKQEKNLININIKDDDKLIEESDIKNVKKDISIINQNLNANLIENDNKSKDQLIDEDINKDDKKNSVFISKDNEENNIIKSEIKKDLISVDKKSNDKLIQTDSLPKNKIDKKSFKFNNKETENPHENLIQLEGEEKLGKEKKNVINFFNHQETKSIKNLVDKINKNSIDCESNQSNENNNKSNKYINLDQINNLSYKVEKDKINRNNISVINNYESIFGLLPNDKNESSLLLAPKHNKNIKFGNFDIHSEADKISNQKSGNKMWNKFNWNFK